MRPAFTVHVAPPGRTDSVRFVREGFSVSGAALGPLWLLYQGAWPFAVASAVLLALLPWAVWPGLALLIGVCGQDATRAVLGWRGWRMVDVVCATDTEHAELRWLGRPAVSPSVVG